MVNLRERTTIEVSVTCCDAACGSQWFGKGGAQARIAKERGLQHALQQHHDIVIDEWKVIRHFWPKEESGS